MQIKNLTGSDDPPAFLIMKYTKCHVTSDRAKATHHADGVLNAVMQSLLINFPVTIKILFIV